MSDERPAVQIACPAGCHGGVGGYVTREMAMDGGDMALEGQPVPCGTCGGDGWVWAHPDSDEARAADSEGETNG